MKNCLSIIIVCVLLIGSSTPAGATINGELVDIDGFRVMRLWGTPAQMGYAHGYLLGDEIVQLFDEYFMWIINPTTYENVIKPLFRQWMTIPTHLQTEMDYIIIGAVEAGCNVYSDALNRNLTSEDIAIVNSIVDYSQFTKLRQNVWFGCSSICGWGPGTNPDTSLPGGTIQCRDLDWTDTSNKLLGNKSLIIAYSPVLPNTQDWFSVTFPGFVACLSGMNTNGVGATLNMGNYSVQPSSASGIVPICFQIRQALENSDPNGDESNDAEDVWHVISNQSRIPSTIIHAFSRYYDDLEALEQPSLVIESNHTGIAKRVPNDDPQLAPNFMAATNHHRKLFTPVACSRYSTIVSLVSEDYLMDTAEAWSIESAVHLPWTVQTMLFRPDMRDVFVSATINNTPAPLRTPSYLTWDDVFINTPTPTAPPVCLNTGDANLDAEITASDAQVAFLIALGSYTPTFEEHCAADCNGDGDVTAGDAQAIFLVVLGSGTCLDPLGHSLPNLERARQRAHLNAPKGFIP